MTETPQPDSDTTQPGPDEEQSVLPEPVELQPEIEPEAVPAEEDADATPLLEADEFSTSEPELQAPPPTLADEGDGDAARITEGPESHSDQPPVDRALIDWANECSPRVVAVELKRVEEQVRQLLENRDLRRKRKLAGSRRWAELHEDILSWRYAGRMDEQTLRDLERLISRRHYLFRRLSYLAGTRPTWNT